MLVVLADALRGAREARLRTALATLAPLALLVTMGVVASRSDHERRQLRASLDSEVSRVVQIRSGGDVPSLPAWLPATLADSKLFAEVLALGPAVDGVHGTTGRGPVPIRAIHSRFDTLIVPGCIAGRPVVSLDEDAARDLGLSAPTGALSGFATHVAVGQIRNVPSHWGRPAGGYTRCIDNMPTETVLVLGLVEGVSNVPVASEVVRSYAATLGIGVKVESDEDVVAFRAQIAAASERQMRTNARTVTFGLFGVAALIGLATGIGRRQDLGRTRALGAARLDLATIVVAESVLCALIAVGVGFAVVATLQPTLHLWDGLSWSLSAVALSTLAAVTGALPGAIIAALVDPARVMRHP